MCGVYGVVVAKPTGSPKGCFPSSLGCGLNYHKRCAFSIPNNCSGARKRRLSSTSLANSQSLRLSTTDSLPSVADELVSNPPTPVFPGSLICC